MTEARLPFLLSTKLDHLQAVASRLTLREAVQMSMRLEDARRRLAHLETVPPVLRVLIFGGTGVGKSALFSALVGQGGASPSSDDVRLYTSALTLAEIKALYGVVGHWKLDETSGVIYEAGPVQGHEKVILDPELAATQVERSRTVLVAAE